MQTLVQKIFNLAAWEKFWKTKLRWNLLIFGIVFGILLVIDLVSKSLIYDGRTISTEGPTQANWGAIAFRSQFHTSTTFFDSINVTLPRWASLLLNYAIIFIFALFTFSSSNKLRTAALCVAFSGVVGNTIDVTIFGGVRNVLFIPYNDRGTFNFADFFIILGLALVPLSLIIEFGVSYFKRRRAAKKVAAEAVVIDNEPSEQ